MALEFGRNWNPSVPLWIIWVITQMAMPNLFDGISEDNHEQNDMITF
jgi:hypothetical protein